MSSSGSSSSTRCASSARLCSRPCRGSGPRGESRRVAARRRTPAARAAVLSARGTAPLIGLLAPSRRSLLGGVWLPSSTEVRVGEWLPASQGGGAAAALASLRGARLGVRIATAVEARGSLTLVLAGGLQLRLGDTGDLRLKLAIARRILMASG